MAKKLEGILTGTDNGPGYELGNGAGYCDFWEGKERKFGKGKQNATLIAWGQSPHERVFTESEVRELVDALCALPNFIPHRPLAETLKQTMREVSARYFDPA